MSGAFETPFFQGRGGRRGSSIVPLEFWKEWWWFPIYALRATIALSLTVQPQLAIEMAATLNSTGGRSLGKNFMFPLELEHPWCCGLQRANAREINREIIFEDFQPMWSRYLNVTDRRTDRRLCRSNTREYIRRRSRHTALCTASRGKSDHRFIALFSYFVCHAPLFCLCYVLRIIIFQNCSIFDPFGSLLLHMYIFSPYYYTLLATLLFISDTPLYTPVVNLWSVQQCHVST